jgi:hypothetical protein
MSLSVIHLVYVAPYFPRDWRGGRARRNDTFIPTNESQTFNLRTEEDKEGRSRTWIFNDESG